VGTPLPRRGKRFLDDHGIWSLNYSWREAIFRSGEKDSLTEGSLDSVAVTLSPRAAVFPPGPRDWTPGPFLRGIREDNVGDMSALSAQHGDAVGVRGGPVRMVALRRPEHARHVLIRNARNYWKGRQLGKLRPLAGDGVFFADGDEWRRQRKLVVPAFQRARI